MISFNFYNILKRKYNSVIATGTYRADRRDHKILGNSRAKGIVIDSYVASCVLH